MKSLPREILLGIVRHAVTAAGIMLVSKGWLIGDEQGDFVSGMTEIIGGAITVAGLSWSTARKVKRARLAQAVTLADRQALDIAGELGGGGARR